MSNIELYSFITWITVLTPSYTDFIIAGLVKKGYVVSATAAKGQVTLFTQEQNASAILSLKIDTLDKLKKARDIFDDVILVLEEIKAFYYSVIVSQYISDCKWSSTNILISNKNILSLDEKDIKSKLN